MFETEIRALREQIGTNAAEMAAILAAAATRDLDDAENTRAAELESQNEALERRRATLERAAQVRASMTESAGRTSNPLPTETRAGARHPYSIMRALGRILEGRALDGIEGETQAAMIERHAGRSVRGLLLPWQEIIPHDTRARMLAALETRAAGDFNLTAAAGAVTTEFAPESMLIEFLRNRTLAVQLGATVMPDLQGKLSIPRQTAANTFQWVAEGGEPTGTNATFDALSLVPNTLTGWTKIFRSTLKQSGYAVESLTRRDLSTGIGVALDKAAFSGSGSGAEPAGLTTISGITTVALGTNGLAPTRSMFVKLETAVADGNADMGRLAYVTTPKVRGKCKETEVSASTGIYVVNDRNEVLGQPLAVTKQLPDNLTKGTSAGVCSAAVYGNFESLIMALWGGVDLLPNPYSDNSGAIKLNIFLDADIDIRRTADFARCLDILSA